MEERESRGMVEHERICERSAGDRGEAVAGGRAWVGVDTVIPETLYILHFGSSDVSMIERGIVKHFVKRDGYGSIKPAGDYPEVFTQRRFIADRRNSVQSDS